MPRFQRTALNKSIGHHRENLAIILSGHVTLIIIELSRIQSTARNKIFQRIELSIAWKVNYKFLLNTWIEKNRFQTIALWIFRIENESIFFYSSSSNGETTP